MAEVVLGIGSSRSPMTALPPEMWPALGERDKLSTRIKDRFGVPHQLRGAAGEGPRFRRGPPDARGHATEVGRRPAPHADAGGHHRRGAARRRRHDGRRRGREHRGRQPPRDHGLLRRLLPPHPSLHAAGRRRDGAAVGCVMGRRGGRPSNARRHGVAPRPAAHRGGVRRVVGERAEGGRGHGPRLRLHAGPDDARHVGPLRAHHPQRAHAAQPANAQAALRLWPRRAGRRSRMARR